MGVFPAGTKKPARGGLSVSMSFKTKSGRKLSIEMMTAIASQYLGAVLPHVPGVRINNDRAFLWRDERRRSDDAVTLEVPIEVHCGTKKQNFLHDIVVRLIVRSDTGLFLSWAIQDETSEGKRRAVEISVRKRLRSVGTLPALALVAKRESGATIEARMTPAEFGQIVEELANWALPK